MVVAPGLARSLPRAAIRPLTAGDGESPPVVGYHGADGAPSTFPLLPGASFRLPPQLEGLRRLAYNMWWSWNPRARALFSRIDGLAWSRYRNPIEVLSQPIAWSELLDDPAFMAECSQVLAEFDRYMAGGKEHWFNREYGRRDEGPDRLLLRRVRLPREPRHLLRRPGRPGRRPHQVRQRHGHAVRRRRACSTSTATSARRSTPTATRSTPTPTTT